MELHGKVVEILPLRNGVSQRTGEQWSSQGFVLEMDGQYLRRARLNLWGIDRIQAANLQLGQYITAKFEIEAHEHNGDWYNDCRVYDIICNGVALLRRPKQQAPQQQVGYQQAPQQQAPYHQAPPQPYTQQQYAQQQQQEQRPW